MWSAFELSLRGRGVANSVAKPQGDHASNTAAELRTKKSVSWGDRETGSEPLIESTKENGSDSHLGEHCAKGSNSTATTAGGTMGGANATLTGIQDQGLDHLRVPSTRPVGSRGDHHRDNTSSGSTGGRSSYSDLHAAPNASSARKRVGEAPGIRAGAVRVRTPAKPKRQRAALTPAAAASTASSRAAAASTARSVAAGDGQELRERKTSPRNYLRRGGGITAPAMSPSRMTSLRTACPPAEAEAAATATVSPARVGRRPTGSPRPSCLASSAGMALRNVTGGNTEGAECLDASEEDDLNNLSLSAGGSSFDSSLGRSPRADRGGSPRPHGFPPRSPRASAEKFHGPPSPASGASTSFVSSTFSSWDRILEEDEEDDEGGEENVSDLFVFGLQISKFCMIRGRFVGPALYGRMVLTDCTYLVCVYEQSVTCSGRIALTILFLGSD